MLTVADDGWAEYARRVLEREPSSQVVPEVTESPAPQGLRTARGWGKPGVEVPKPVLPTEDADDEPSLTFFRM